MAELWSFLKDNKRWWVPPLIITPVLAAGLVVIGTGNVEEPPAARPPAPKPAPATLTRMVPLPDTALAGGVVEVEGGAPASAPTRLRLAYDPRSGDSAVFPEGPLVVAAGTFQAFVGCEGNWLPGCLRTALITTSDAGYTRSFRLPRGHYEAKVALEGTWAENYGLDGGRDGPNLGFEVRDERRPVLLTWDPSTHLLSVAP